MNGGTGAVSASHGGASDAISTEHRSGAGPVFHTGDEVRAVMTASDWPLWSYLELGALDSAVPCARAYAKEMLWEWGLNELGETVGLVVSELVTNSVQASKGLAGAWYGGTWRAGVPPVRLWLSSDKERVLIQVWDGDHGMPVRREIEDLEAESGRGLMIVDAFCEEWGAYRPEGGSGKVIWARTAPLQLIPAQGH